MPQIVEDWLLEEFRLAASVKIEEIDPTASECWIWNLESFNRDTYPGFTKMRNWVKYAEKVSRLSYMLFHGEIPDDQPVIRHTCDMKWCWNFHHLIVGTHQDNMNDMKERGDNTKRLATLKNARRRDGWRP